MNDGELRAWLEEGRFEPGLAEDLRRLLTERRARTVAAPETHSMGTLAPHPGEASESPPPTPRYRHIRVLGRGGMSEVWLCYDEVLQREVALKLLRAGYGHDPAARDRFLREAHITGQLQHPGIIPVHDLVLVDGHPELVLKVIGGPTFAHVIDQLHAPAPDGEPWTLRRTLGALARAAQAVAYAHGRGVIHRDLKPSNIMVGEYGEVLVLDWGLARRHGDADHRGGGPEGGRDATRAGSVLGTPHFLAPEQARGEPVDERADVYSLGATLYQVLQGTRPFSDRSTDAALAAARAGERPPLSVDQLPEATRVAGVEGLAALCAQAMAPAREDRPASAGPFAAALERWLDGAHRREQAEAVVARARALGVEERELRAASEARKAAARALLDGVPGWAPVEDKAAAWAEDDQARSLLAEAQQRGAERVALLQAALTYDPDLPGAHADLADHYQALHQQAADTRRAEAASRAEAMLRRHDRGRWARYLAGTGALTLVTDPPGAHAELWRYVPRSRRLVPERVGELGPTPIVARELAQGSYLVRLRADGHLPVDYPVLIRRLEHWDGVPPGGGDPLPIPLPRLGELGPDDCYVPAGHARLGEDGSALAWPVHRAWVPGVVVRRFPVTHGEVLAWLDTLVDEGRADLAERWQPRGPASPGGKGQPCYARDPHGHFVLVPDAQGDVWDPRWPAFHLDWYSASAFAAWAAEREGLPWRLPRDPEWEKAARGVDGRTWPWGESFDPAFARVRESLPTKPLPARVDEYPLDASPFGVRGCAGNVREWTADAEGEDRVVRGGAFFYPMGGARPSYRMRLDPTVPSDTIGFRLARPWPTTP